MKGKIVRMDILFNSTINFDKLPIVLKSLVVQLAPPGVCFQWRCPEFESPNPIVTIEFEKKKNGAEHVEFLTVKVGGRVEIRFKLIITCFDIMIKY